MERGESAEVVAEGEFGCTLQLTLFLVGCGLMSGLRIRPGGEREQENRSRTTARA